jgi:murein DD-endopeptidase MepM/ murein hydrolase activator NlpD
LDLGEGNSLFNNIPLGFEILPSVLVIDLCGVFSKADQPSKAKEIFSKRYYHTPLGSKNQNSSTEKDTEFYLPKICETHEAGFSVLNAPLNPELIIDKLALHHFYYNVRVSHEFFKTVLIYFPEALAPKLKGIFSLSNVVLLESHLNQETFNLLHPLTANPDAPVFLYFSDSGLSSNLIQAKSVLKKIRNEGLTKPFVIPLNIEPALLKKILKESLKLSLLRRNPPGALLSSFRILRWPVLFLVFLIMILQIKTLEPDRSHFKSLKSERRKILQDPFISYKFDGNMTLQRIAKYAIGRHRAMIPKESELQKYIEEVKLKNPSVEKSLKTTTDGAIFVPDGVTMRFYPPNHLHNNNYDSIAPAYRYYTRLINDSIAYLTDHWWEAADSLHRKHEGIDIGTRMGARLLAPFSGVAHTRKTERGGVVLAVRNEKYVMIFAHCDQLLYLDGQKVMKGDPIATVGMTGRTTGPHVHLETAEVVKSGGRSFGNFMYKPIDPIRFYYILHQDTQNE